MRSVGDTLSSAWWRPQRVVDGRLIGHPRPNCQHACFALRYSAVTLWTASPAIGQKLSDSNELEPVHKLAPVVRCGTGRVGVVKNGSKKVRPDFGFSQLRHGKCVIAAGGGRK